MAPYALSWSGSVATSAIAALNAPQAAPELASARWPEVTRAPSEKAAPPAPPSSASPKKASPLSHSSMMQTSTPIVAPCRVWNRASSARAPLVRGSRPAVARSVAAVTTSPRWACAVAGWSGKLASSWTSAALASARSPRASAANARS